MRAILALTILCSQALWAADEIPLSEFISLSQPQLLDTSEMPVTSMIDVKEQTLSELIKNQEGSAAVHEIDDLLTESLSETSEIGFTQHFINSVSYEDDHDEAEHKKQANQDAKQNSCDKGDDENTVCANIICDFGSLMGKWSSECTQHKLDLVRLKALTPPWKKLPKCKMVDESCNDAGRASKKEVDNNFCDSITDLEKRHACLLGVEIGEEKTAAQYIERNNGDVSTLDVIEFDLIEGEVQDHSNSFLVLHVDARFSHDDDLYKNNGGYVPAERLSDYLENRHNLTVASSIRQQLIDSDIMRSECADVTVDKFYNCNQFSNIPQRCWSAPNNESIAECVRES